jgi:hypothetical protein
MLVTKPRPRYGTGDPDSEKAWVPDPGLIHINPNTAPMLRIETNLDL